MRSFFISLCALTALIFAGCGGGSGGGGGGNPIVYSVTFYDEFDSKIDELTESVEYGVKIDLKTREKPGYTFDGWQIDGAGDLYKTEYTVIGNTEFHAKFSRIVYQVNFYEEIGGTPIPVISRPVNAGDPITLLPITKTGYTFQGWKIDNEGDALNEPYEQYIVNQALSFYAVFTPGIIIRVTIDGEVIEHTITDGNFTVPPATDPDTRFMWNTSPDGLGEELIPGDVIPVSYGFNLYPLMKGDHPNYPIEISDAEGLKAISDMPALHYKLASIISLEGSEWIPIGSESDPFSGTLDGGGFKITELYINSTTSYIGLFGNLTGTVKNLGVEIAESGVTGTYYTGAIAGRVSGGTITDSYSTGSVSGSYFVGGIAGGVEYGRITNSYSTGSVSGNRYVGGIGGGVSGNTITDSYSTGDISGSFYVGGIAGFVNGSTITDSYSTGSVNGSDDYVGGIAGEVSGGTITNSYSTGNVNSTGNYSGYSGGIAGVVYIGRITNSYSTGSVSGNIGVGGIAGRVEIGSTIANNAAANSNITGSGSVSRVVGWIYGSGSNITNNFANSGMTAGGSAFDPTAANYGVSKTLTELQTITPYSTPINGDGLGGLGWQFCNGTTILCDDAHPWKMPSGGTGFPILYWQP